MITVPQRHRQTDGQLALAIPRSTRLRAVKIIHKESVAADDLE